MAEPDPPKPAPGVARVRTPYARGGAAGVGATGKQLVVVFYAALAVVLAGLAGYMALVNHMPLLSAYVIAPVIGAAWFALRVFMLIAPKG